MTELKGENRILRLLMTLSIVLFCCAAAGWYFYFSEYSVRTQAQAAEERAGTLLLQRAEEYDKRLVAMDTEAEQAQETAEKLTRALTRAEANSAAYEKLAKGLGRYAVYGYEAYGISDGSRMPEILADQTQYLHLACRVYDLQRQADHTEEIRLSFYDPQWNLLALNESAYGEYSCVFSADDAGNYWVRIGAGGEPFLQAGNYALRLFVGTQEIFTAIIPVS